MVETVGSWSTLLERLYPRADASEGDPVGLQVGEPTSPVERVLVTLDVTLAVVEEAAAVASTLVVAHHPLLFRPLARLTPASASGRIALAAARQGVAVTAVHTNLDVTQDGAGTSEPVARLLGLVDAVPLEPDLRASDDVKLVTFVPHEHLDPVLDALAAQGAGVIGEYERCSFRVGGTGTFRPREGTAPYTGEVGEENEEEEARLEIVVPSPRLARVARALIASHPYEEVAYDVYPLRRGGERGIGLVGDLPEPIPLRGVAELVRERLPAPDLRVAGDLSGMVRRLAVVGGSGMSLASRARAAGADALVTGDAKHHDTLDALTVGLAIVDAGHHATEAAAMPAWTERLQRAAAETGLNAEVVASRVDTCPWSERGRV